MLGHIMTSRILLQTTIPPSQDDWSIDRFSLLASLLRDQRDESEQPLFDVTARELPAAERDEIIPKLTAAVSAFAEYQAKTSRVIPIFELQRTD